MLYVLGEKKTIFENSSSIGDFNIHVDNPQDSSIKELLWIRESKGRTQVVKN